MAAFTRACTLLVLLVMMLTVLAVICTCTVAGDEYGYEQAKEKAEQVRQKTVEMGTDAKESSESWANWAKDKISGVGLKQEDQTKETANQASDAAGDAAKKAATEKDEETVTQKDEEAKEAAASMGKEAVEEAKTKEAEAESAKDTIKKKSQGVKENLSDRDQDDEL